MVGSEANPTKCSIVLADDHVRVRARVEELVSASHHVLAAVENGEQAIDAVTRLHPEVVILDISMPVINGMEAARRIRHVAPETKIIFLTIQFDADYIAAASEMNAGYVLKQRMHTDLLHAIAEARRGGAWSSPPEENSPAQ